MLRVIVFACFILFYFNLNAAPAVTFIEFTPIAAIITKATVNEYKYNFEYNLPSIDAPRSLPDIDKDKKAEIELDFYETGITLYAEIRDKSLNIDYSSSKYNDIFNMLDIMEEKDDYQFMQYLMYGVLAGRLTKQQAEDMYISHIRESNLKLQHLITNMKRIKGLSEQYQISSQMVEYFSRDIEQDELFQLIDSLPNSREFKKRISLLDEQLKLLKIDEVILNDFSTYISGYLNNREFADLLTIAAVPSYIDINAVISNIFILDSIMHKYGYNVYFYIRGNGF